MTVRGKLLRWLFHRLYRQWAPLYDVVSRVAYRGQWQRWQRAAATRIVGPQILEIGFGTGDLLVYLSQLGYLSYGLDSSWRMVQIARLKLCQARFPARLCLGEAQRLPFLDSTFNTVVLTFPAEFIYDSSVWQELDRVLAPGGRAVIVDGGQLEARGPLSAMQSWTIAFILGATGSSRPLVPSETASFRFTQEQWLDRFGRVWIAVGEKEIP